MTTSMRRRFGGVLAVLAVVIVLALAIAGIPLLTRSSKHFAETGATSSSLQVHWALYVCAAAFVLGVCLVLAPRRRLEASETTRG